MDVVNSYVFLREKLHAAGPVHPSHVGGGHAEDVELERLLEEDDVVFGHAEAVVVTGTEKGMAGNCADHFNLLQWRDTLALL